MHSFTEHLNFNLGRIVIIIYWSFFFVKVDCSRAGNSSLDVNVTNSQDFVKNNIDERGQGLYDVTFMPTIPDNYNVNVYFGGDQVAGKSRQTTL